MEFLKKIDLYPEILCFNIKSNQKHSTNIGGILGILLMIVFVSLFLLLGWDCFKRTNPKIVQQNTSSSGFQQFNLKPGDFNISFTFYQLNEKGLNKIPPHYFKIIFNHSTHNGTFPAPFLKESILSDKSSIGYNIIRPVSVYDFFTDNNNYSFIPFTINLCSPTDYSKCSMEVIENASQTSLIFVSVTLYSSGLDLTNIENPLISIKKDFFIKLNTYASKNMFFTFKKVRAENDLGWLFKVPKIQEGIDIESFLDDFNSINIESNFGTNLFNGFLIFGRKLDFYSISYTKVPDVIAQVGGLVNVCNIIFKIIANIYSQNEIDNYLVNSLMDENLKERRKRSHIKLDTSKFHQEILELPQDIAKIKTDKISDMSIFQKLKAQLCKKTLNKFELERFIKFSDCLEKSNKFLDINEYFELRKKINYLELLQIPSNSRKMTEKENNLKDENNSISKENKNILSKN